MTDEVAGFPATAQDSSLSVLEAQTTVAGQKRDNHGDSLVSSRAPPATRTSLPTKSSSGNLPTDPATAVFIKRTLCAHHLHSNSTGEPPSFDALLPPLTSSNEIDLELYAFIAIIIKDFVYSWYSKITSDHVFVDEVVHIIAHCTRALEERLRKLDIEALLLDEIPALLDVHINGPYRIGSYAGEIWLTVCDQHAALLGKQHKPPALQSMHIQFITRYVHTPRCHPCRMTRIQLVSLSNSRMMPRIELCWPRVCWRYCFP